MSCPAVIDVLVPSGPVVVEVVTPGPPGAIGSRWFTGSAVPGPGVGAVGDFYLRENGDVYGPKTSGGWGSVQFTLTGSGGAALSDDAPLPLGTAAAGTSAKGSRSDHRHALPSAQQVGADPTGTASSAIAAHLLAADPHSQYTTAAEVSNALLGYLTTSAAAQAYQPLDPDLTALAAVADQTAFGRAFLALVNRASARDYIGLGPGDTATLTGLTLTGLATLPHIHGNLAGGLYAHVKNLSGGALAAGTPLRITGTVGNTTTLEVVAASASSAGTMPALFVLSEALANNAEGHATLLGEITGLNTAGMTLGAPLFVAPSGGMLTTTRPAANAQQVATVGRVHANTGSVHVLPWPVLGTAAAAAIGDFATAAQAAALATALAGKAETGLIASSGLTMNPNRLAGRISAGVGTVEEVTPAGGMVLIGGNLVPGEIVKLVVSNIGETGITTGNFKNETRIDRPFTLLGLWWNCHPTAMGSASTSDARPYVRTGAGTTSAGTKTNILTTTNNIASLAASVHTVDATSSISGGEISGSAGDWLGADLMSVGTGSSGHFLTFILRYS
jgi:hypothetical protein